MGAKKFRGKYLEHFMGEGALIVGERGGQSVRIQMEVYVNQVAQKPLGIPIVLRWLAYF